MKNYLKIATLALPLLFGGCETERKEPKRSDYDDVSGIVYTRQGIMHFNDTNKNGNVDMFVLDGRGPVFLTEEFSGRQNWRDVPTASTKVANLASEITRLQQDFRYELDKADWDKRQKRSEQK